MKEYKSLITNKSFVYIWVSQILSQLTINIVNFIFLIRLFEVTKSAISSAFLWIAFAVPAILVGPFASASVDLVNKRKMLIASNFLQFLTIILYSFSPKTNVFLLYEVVFIYSLINQFYVPAEAASLPSILNKNKLAQGNGLFFLTQQGSLVVGFAIAGFLNVVLGFQLTLFLCSAFLFIAFISTTFLPNLEPVNTIPKKFETAVFSFFEHMVDGYKYIKSEKRVLTPFFLLIGFQVVLQIVTVQFPVLANDVLNIPLNAAGILILVPAGIGATIGALIVPKMLKNKFRKKTIIEISTLFIGISLLLLIFVLPLLGYWYHKIFSFFFFALMGTGFVGVVVPSQTFLQESTPEDLRGRVFGNFWFLVTAASVLPIVFSGTVVEFLGIRSLIIIISLIAIGVFVISKKWGDAFLSD